MVKHLISTGNLAQEKKERMEEMLTEVVENYVQFNVFPRNDGKLAWRYLLDYLHNTYNVLLVALGKISVIITLDCRTLESLDRLCRDSCSTDLGKIAERCLMADGINKKRNFERICLKTTIKEIKYSNCKEALMKRPGASSSEYKLNTQEIQLCCTCRHFRSAFQIKKCTIYK